jgi:hypothetical protein
MSDPTASQLPVHTGEVIEPEKDPGKPLPAVFRARRRNLLSEEVTEDHIERFLATLAETGVYKRSADASGLSYMTIQRLKRDDEEFQTLCDEALQTYREHLLMQCHQRAFEGWEEPVFSQKLGTEIGRIQRFDSRLAELFLKRHHPEFREKFEGEIKVTGGVLVAPIAPLSAIDWAAQHGGKKIELLANDPPTTLALPNQEQANGTP